MYPRTWAALYFLFYFGANGALFPYYNLYYQQAGVSSQGIGVLVAIPTLVTLFAAPMWGGLADALGLHKRLLPLALIATTIAVSLLLQAQSFAVLMACVLLQALCAAPIISLADNAVMELLGKERHRYGSLRLWGAVGFGLSALASGALITRFGFTPSLAVYAALMLGAAYVATRLPAPQLASPPVWRDLGQTLTHPRWTSFLLALFLVGACAAILNNYFILHMTGLGASAGLFGLSVAVAGVSELPVFFLAPRVIQRGQARGLLMIALAAYALRAFIYSQITDPIWGVAAQLLHGLSFAALWTASVTYAREIAPPGWGATAQAAIGSVMFGIAVGAGALLGGLLYGSAGPVVTFQVAALMALAGLILFAWQVRRAAKTGVVHTRTDAAG
jgi:PPP family 3-phenylpropionic acid transporter